MLTRATALLLTVLTGFTGLVYEVAWQKYLATLVGSHAEATAAVLAIFLGGLAVGYGLFGRVTERLTEQARRSGKPLRLLFVYGLVECGIGVYALMFPLLFGIAQSVSLLAPFHAGLGFAFDVLLIILLIGPPTVLMGATIPVLTLAIAGDLQHATRVHAWIYGFNTIGAFVGALAGGLFLVPLMGLDAVVRTMGVLNLAAGTVFVTLDRWGARVTPDLAQEVGRTEPVTGFAGYAAIAFLGGFSMMAVQTTLNRIGSLAFGASHFTFAMVVAVFVLCIALGSFAVSLLRTISPLLIVTSQWLLVLILGLLYAHLPDATYYAHALRMFFRNESAAFYPFHLTAFFAALAVLLVPIGLSGALLPLLFHHLRRQVGTLGAVAGRLYSWNTVGSLCGALLGGYVLLFWLDLHHVYRIALATSLIGAAILSVLVLRISPYAIGLVVLLPALLGLSLLPRWNPARLAIGAFRDRQPLHTTFAGPTAFFEKLPYDTIFFEDDPTSTVTVREGPVGDGRVTRGLYTNGKADGNLIIDNLTMALTGLFPALMAEHLERCFVIGYGLGITVGELAALEDTREVRVAEISRGVIDAAALFDAGNLAASRSPKVSIQRSDAYRALLRSDGQWDVIVSEPSNPWVTGVEMLYSIEFLSAARERLAPGGVYAQWFHLYEMDAETVDIVLRNYTAVFPHVSLWVTMRTDVLLLGFDRPERALDLKSLQARFRRPDFSAAFARVGIETLPALLAHEALPLGTLRAAQLEGELHTLRHPILSHHAARAFFIGDAAPLRRFVTPESARVGVRNSLLGRLADSAGRLPERVLEQAVVESCRTGQGNQCAALFARWRYDYPDSERREQALQRARRPGRYDQGARRAAVELDPATLRDLYALYDDEAAPPQDARPAQLTNRYVSYYHYAAPFERSVVERAWAQCVDPSCEMARRRAEASLGPLPVGSPERAKMEAPPR
ncbi:MAG TPA: fused MFS/spermidine synthase [Myxococcota bacterium]